MGGRIALLAMVSLPDRFRCGCTWYGGGMFNQLGSLPAPADRVAAIKSPLIGFFGNRDKRPSPQEVDTLDARLNALGKVHEFHRYDADHTFMTKDDGRYDESAAQDSWRRAIAFLDRHLRGAEEYRQPSGTSGSLLEATSREQEVLP
jgi:carboxymethylenebutenolidase